MNGWGHLTRSLAACGVTAVYGELGPGPSTVPVADADCAWLLAAAHGRLCRGAGVARLPGRILRFCAEPGRRPDATVTVSDVSDLAEAVAGAASRAAGSRAETVDVVLACDLDAAAAPGAPVQAPVPQPRWLAPSAELVETVRRAQRPVVLAGPGAARSGCVPGLHALAASAALGVLNTWGAKGIFDWRSVHHLATAGLQRDDFTLAGLADADLILTVGLDDAEAGGDRWRLAPDLDVPPAVCSPLAEQWSRQVPVQPPVPLRDRLSALVAAWWDSHATPMPPARAVADWSEVLGPRGLLAADVGEAGLWAARTFATTELGSVQVPARAGTEGWAVACALVARLLDPTRPVLAAIAGVPGPRSRELLEVAARLDVSVPVEAWREDAAALDQAAHRDALGSALASETGTVVPVRVDPSCLADLVEVAGEVAAWH